MADSEVVDLVRWERDTGGSRNTSSGGSVCDTSRFRFQELASRYEVMDICFDVVAFVSSCRVLVGVLVAAVDSSELFSDFLADQGVIDIIGSGESSLSIIILLSSSPIPSIT